MPTLTTNYSLQKPLVNDATDEDLWGDELNDDLDDLDTLLRVGITVAPQASQVIGFTATSSISVKYLYPCDTTSAGFTATLPAASAAASGATVFIKKTDATSNIVTIGRTGVDTLDGATSLTIETQNGTYGMVSDGVSKWFSICKPSQNIPDASTTVKGIVELATAAEALAGTDTVRAITPDAFAGNKSLASSGYYKFPGGLVVQWGQISSGGSADGSVVFPVAFSSAIYTITSGSGAPGGGTCTFQNATTSGFDYTRRALNVSDTSIAYWMALGK